MEGIEKITARIIEDAEREIAQMQRENEEKINALTAEAQSVAEQESLELLTRGRRAADQEQNRRSRRRTSWPAFPIRREPAAKSLVQTYPSTSTFTWCSCSQAIAAWVSSCVPCISVSIMPNFTPPA